MYFLCRLISFRTRNHHALQGDILAFRQFYHDFTRYHLPSLMPPLLHASATTSVVVGGEPAFAQGEVLLPLSPPTTFALSSSFSGPPGAK